MASNKPKYVGHLQGVSREKGETHLYFRFGDSGEGVEISRLAYGYKGFVSLGRTYEHHYFKNFLFRKRDASYPDGSYLRWDDVKDLQVRSLALDVFAQSEHAADVSAMEALVRS